MHSAYGVPGSSCTTLSAQMALLHMHNTTSVTWATPKICDLLLASLLAPCSPRRESAVYRCCSREHGTIRPPFLRLLFCYVAVAVGAVCERSHTDRLASTLKL
jgi:hypothetical protein